MLMGNAIVGQSGGPTSAINATLSGVIKEALASRYIDKVYGMRNGIEGLLERRTVLLNEIFEDREKLRILEQTPSAALGSCRMKLPDPTSSAHKDKEIYKKLFSILSELKIKYFFYIGGNDSMDTVKKMNLYASANNVKIRIIGVPKTIDNDLELTDHSPGYGSAAKYIATTIREIIRDCSVYTIPAVTIVEIMGRDAGWLTAASAVGRIVDGIAPDYVYLPETPFNMELFFGDIKKAFSKHPNVVIAVSEGLRYADGRYVGWAKQSGVIDVFGHKYLSGTGKAIELAIKERFGCKVRTVEMNISQRCAGHLLSETDIAESVEVGKQAVKAAVRGESGKMMIILRDNSEEYKTSIGATDIMGIANNTKFVPEEYINESGNNVTDECCRYILPLIKGEYKTLNDSGFPAHLVI